MDVSPAPIPPSASAARWSGWQRILFRYLLCHCLLYSLPGPLSILFGTLDKGIGFLASTFDLPLLRTGPWLVLGQVSEVLSDWTSSAWSGLATWLHGNGLTPVDVFVQPTGSGDTGAEFVRLGCIVILSLLITALWTFLSRAGGYPRLGRWLHAFARWDVAFVMLGYGFHKVYGGQFGTPSLGRLTQEVGDMSPMGMVWTFMAASRPYELFGALGEIVGGLLLFHRRTALLGCLVTIGVMLNVCALNWLYDVPVKLFSTHLLLYAVFLLAPFRHRLWALLVSGGHAAPVDLRLTRVRWLGVCLAVFGWTWAIAHLGQTHLSGMRRLAADATRLAARPQLYGIWNVESMSADGVELPATDASRWRFLAIDDGGRGWLREVSGRAQGLTVQENLASAKLNLQPQGGAAADWTVELGTKTVQVAHPAPRTRDEFGQTVDAERRSLVLRGKWGERDLEVRTVERVFRLHRGFHWVQEMPFNR